MRNPEPVEGDTSNHRYDDDADERQIKDAPISYNYRPVTLEEEAYFGGWQPKDRPTGPPPNDLYTIGMRGEPGWDDDPQFNNGAATVTHPPAK